MKKVFKALLGAVVSVLLSPELRPAEIRILRAVAVAVAAVVVGEKVA